MLQLCGAKWEPRFVDFFNGATRAPEYRANVNEMGEAPVLEHQGKRLSQSGVILHYLADHFRKFQGEDKLEVLRWILWDNHKLTSYIATLRWMVTLAKVGEPQVHEFLRGRVKTSLGILDGHLAKSDFAAETRRASPTSRCAATCTGRKNSAYRGPTIRASALGSSASARSRDGFIRTS